MFEILKQLKNVDMFEIEYATIPLSEVNKLDWQLFKDKIIISLPRYTKNEDKIIKQLEEAKKNGFTKIECSNFAHIRIGRKLKFEMFGGYGLNVTNSYTLKVLAEYGLTDVIASFELKLSQIKTCRLSSLWNYAYGKLPVMLTVNCPIKQAVGCENVKASLPTGQTVNLR